MTALDATQVAQLAGLFHLLGDPSRLRIVLACLAGPRAVGDVAEGLKLSPSLVSHHLRLLRTARLLRPERRGRQVLYALDDDHVRDMLANVIAHVAEPHSHHGAEPHHEHANEAPNGR